MAANSSSVSALSWYWVIEYLSTRKEVDPGLLNELIARTPEISSPLAKIARERVSLRCLDSLCDVSTPENSSPSLDSGVGVKSSESCEDVMQRIVSEVPMSNLKVAGQKLSKWNIHSYITHKQTCLPKCALLLLKDAIDNGAQSFPVPLKEDGQPVTGGWTASVSKTTVESMVEKLNLATTSPKIINEILMESVHNQGVLPLKRDREVLVNGNIGQYYDDLIDTDNGDVFDQTSKKFKNNSTCTRISMKTNELLPGDELFEKSSGGEGLHSSKGCLDESNFVVECHFEDASTRHGKNSSNDFRNQDNQLLDMHDGDKIHQAASGDEHFSDVSASEAGSDGDNPERSQQRITIYEAKDVGRRRFKGKLPIDAPLEGPCAHAMEEKNDRDISTVGDGFHDEEFDITRMKQIFFSQYRLSSSQPFETAEFSELNICVKCNQGGRLLVCSSTACPLVVHEACLGSSPSFDDFGNFYCPFCAYSQAISEYLKAKKKSFLVRKELAEFMGFGNKHLGNNISPKALHENKGSGNMIQEFEGRTGEEQRGQIQADPKSKVDDQRHAGIGVRKEVLQECVTDQSRDDVHKSRNTDYRETSQSGRALEELNKQLEADPKGKFDNRRCAVVGIQKEVILQHGDPSQANALKFKDNNFGETSKSGRVPNKLFNKVQAGEKGKVNKNRHEEVGTRETVLQEGASDVSQSNSKPKDIDSLETSYVGRVEEELHNQVQAAPEGMVHIPRDSEVGTDKQVLQHACDLKLDQASKLENMDREGTPKEKNHKSTTAHYSMRTRKQERIISYPAIPRLGRKKNPWTAAEEETLKEGVRRFAGVGKIPWQKILEFGASGFQKGRTAIDLKDKWRNICKGNSKYT